MPKNQINKLIEEYIEMATFHGFASSFDQAEVKKINKAANTMLKIAEVIDAMSGTQVFSKLLEHPNSSVRSWCAFNLIERVHSDTKTTKRALDVIKELANSDSVDAYGAELWLKQYEKTNP